MPEMVSRVFVPVAIAACGSPTPAPEQHINGTSVVIVANHCSHLSKQASREAEATMGRLVDHCNAPVEHPATFRVILDPSGAIRFANVPDAGTDEIPICVVTQSLHHHVRLATACQLDVRFEPTSIVPH